MVYIVVSLALVAGLYFGGVFSASNLTHPAWRVNAPLFGSLAGAGLSALMFWLRTAKPRLGRNIEWVIMAGFILALAVTLISARRFIDAPDFDPVAVALWHKGSYMVFITFIPSFAALLAKLRIIGSPRAE